MAGCGGGGTAGSSNAEPSPADTAVSLGCEAELVVNLPGVLLHNNQWNAAALPTGTGVQCLLARATANVTGTGTGTAGSSTLTLASETAAGWRWSWPAGSSEVLSYPSLVFGSKPWPGATTGLGGDSRLPLAIDAASALRLQARMDVRADGAYLQTVSAWLVAADATSDTVMDGSQVRGEVVVVTRMRGDHWLDGRTLDTEVTLAGRRWWVLHDAQWRDASSSDALRWVLVTYVAQDAAQVADGAQVVDVDLKAMLADAVQRGHLEAAWQVADVELGTEIVSGTGSAWASDWLLTVR